MDDTSNPEPSEQPKSAWDDLADEIGATPSSDALERKRRAIESEYEPVKRPKSAPASQSSDWNALAGELGIEVPPSAPPTPPTAKPAEAAAKEAPSRSEKAKRPPRPSRAKGGRDKSRPAQEKRDRKEQEHQVDNDADDSLFADLPTIEGDDDWTSGAPNLDADAPQDSVEPKELAQAIPPEDDSVAEKGDGPSQVVDEADETGADEDEDVDSSSLSGDAARSAFDALFESGSFASMEVPLPDASVDKSRDAGDRSDATDAGADAAAGSDAPPSRGGWFGFGRRRQKSGDAATDKVEATPAEESTDEPEDWLGKSATDSAEMSPADPEGGDAGDDETSKEKTGRRRRRRRRRRPAAKEEPTKNDAIENGQPADAQQSDASASIEDDDDIQDEDDSIDDDGEIGDSTSEENGGSRRRPVHKNIPTWSDAIGVMVDANLQSRKQSRDRPSSRGGSGKGRGRGVRRRKKS